MSGAGNAKVGLYNAETDEDVIIEDGALRVSASEATLAKTVGFPANANITTDLSTPNVIVETDGTKTKTTTISGTTITEVWS